MSPTSLARASGSTKRRSRDTGNSNGRDEKAGAVKKWKIGLVGAGYMAQEHAKAVAAQSEASIVGVCGRGPARTEALAGTYRVPAFQSIAEMYLQTRADAVIVAVNELSMRSVCEQAFEHPWICLLEKPERLL